MNIYTMQNKKIHNIIQHTVYLFINGKLSYSYKMHFYKIANSNGNLDVRKIVCFGNARMLAVR